MLCLSLMREMKGCFVCGEDHLACEEHSREKISIEIERLKAKYPTALISIEDLASIYQMDETDEEGENNEDVGDQMKWAQGENASDIFITALEGKDIEQHLQCRHSCMGGV